VAPGRLRAGAGAHRSVNTPLRRGAVVVAVTGGAFSLVGAASPDAAIVPVAQAQPVEVDAVVLQPSFAPVEPDRDIVDASDLVKAVQLAEQEVARLAAERAAAEAKAVKEKAEAEARAAREKAAAAAAATGSADCGLSTSGLGAVKPFVRSAAQFLGCQFGEPAMHGVAGRAGTSDHPSGLALDFMVDSATGDALASCTLENMEALGVKYVIWEQQINQGSGWEPMEDRGGATANHFDHVHVSFESGAGGGPRGC
jgi:hypothetical protein